MENIGCWKQPLLSGGIPGLRGFRHIDAIDHLQRHGDARETSGEAARHQSIAAFAGYPLIHERPLITEGYVKVL